MFSCPRVEQHLRNKDNDENQSNCVVNITIWTVIFTKFYFDISHFERPWYFIQSIDCMKQDKTQSYTVFTHKNEKYWNVHNHSRNQMIQNVHSLHHHGLALYLIHYQSENIVNCILHNHTTYLCRFWNHSYTWYMQIQRFDRLRVSILIHL